MVTGYNTVAGQTDSTPCIAASGADICGRRDAVACPRRISLGTIVEIRGTTYVCEDRLAKKYDDRFDISCDKDMACPYQVAGWTTVKVYGEEKPVKPAVVSSVRAVLPMRKAVAEMTASKAQRRHVTARAVVVAKAAHRMIASAAGGAVSVLRGHT